jgi:hypothetical protein
MSTMTRVTIVSDDNNKKQKLDTLLNHALERESLLLKTALEKRGRTSVCMCFGLSHYWLS